QGRPRITGTAQDNAGDRGADASSCIDGKRRLPCEQLGVDHPQGWAAFEFGEGDAVDGRVNNEIKETGCAHCQFAVRPTFRGCGFPGCRWRGRALHSTTNLQNARVCTASSERSQPAGDCGLRIDTLTTKDELVASNPLAMLRKQTMH